MAYTRSANTPRRSGREGGTTTTTTRTTTTKPSLLGRLTGKSSRTTTTTTRGARRGAHHKRKPHLSDKVAGAVKKVEGKLTHNPAKTAAGTRRMRGTDGRRSRGVARKRV